MEQIIYESNDKKRIDIYINEIKPEYSRSHIQKMLELGNIKVNGENQKSSYKLKNGDNIVIQDIELQKVELKEEKIELNIVYEDKDILVINKPKGMVVHPANGHESGTLVNAIMYHCKDDLSGINGEIRPGIVHRIDKDTSGILVIAKNDESHNNLAKQFKAHSIKRKYIALVRGVIDKDKININMPIGRSDQNRLKMAVTLKNSKNAQTHIKVLERFERYTLIEATLETGRTHQIRVHMSHIGYPLVGDNVYSNGKNEFEVQGQMLHAKQLGFIHPTTNQYIEFDSKLPEYFENILENLRKEKKEQEIK